MNLERRLERLETTRGVAIGPAEWSGALERYIESYDRSPAILRTITPSEMDAAFHRSRDPHRQRLLCCWLPGDDLI